MRKRCVQPPSPASDGASAPAPPRPYAQRFSRSESLPDLTVRPDCGRRARPFAGDVDLPFAPHIALPLRELERTADEALSTADATETPRDGHAPPGDAGDDGGDDAGESAVAGYLRKELSNVLRENEALAAKVVVLQGALTRCKCDAAQPAVDAAESAKAMDIADIADIAAGVAELGVAGGSDTHGRAADERAADGGATEIDGTGNDVRPRAEAIRKLFELDDELRALEGVVDCMEFSIDTEEAERLQHTLSTIGFVGANTPPFGQNREGEEEGEVAGHDLAGKLEGLAKRVGEIRSTIAIRYGKWLSDFLCSDDDEDWTVSLPLGATLGALPELNNLY